VRFGSLFFSLVALLFSFILLAVGGFFVFIAEIPHFQETLSLFILNEVETVRGIGGGIILLAILLLFVFYQMNRRSYYLIEMGKNFGISIEDQALMAVVRACFQDYFPSQSIHSEVYLAKKGMLEIYVDLPFFPLEEQSKVLISIEKNLEEKLSRICGYRKKFLLNVHFASKP
jgi:hypothetical protein